MAGIIAFALLVGVIYIIVGGGARRPVSGRRGAGAGLSFTLTAALALLGVGYNWWKGNLGSSPESVRLVTIAALAIVWVLMVIRLGA